MQLRNIILGTLGLFLLFSIPSFAANDKISTYKKMCDSNDKNACAMLGKHYYQKKKDQDLSIKYYEKAISNGLNPFVVSKNLALLYLAKGNKEASRKYLKTLCTQGNILYGGECVDYLFLSYPKNVDNIVIDRACNYLAVNTQKNIGLLPYCFYKVSQLLDLGQADSAIKELDLRCSQYSLGNLCDLGKFLYAPIDRTDKIYPYYNPLKGFLINITKKRNKGLIFKRIYKRVDLMKKDKKMSKRLKFLEGK